MAYDPIAAISGAPTPAPKVVDKGTSLLVGSVSARQTNNRKEATMADNSKTKQTKTNGGKAKRTTAPTTKPDPAADAEAQAVKERNKTELAKSVTEEQIGNLVAPANVTFTATADVDDCVVTLRPFVEDDAEYFEIDQQAAVNKALGRSLINIGDEEGETDYLLADFESFMLSMYALAQATGTPIPSIPNN